MQLRSWLGELVVDGRVLLGRHPIEDREQLKALNTLRPSQAVLDLASAVRFEFIGTFMLCRSLCKF